MSDKKISQLTGATTPLAGTEVLPVVQSGQTRKVSVDDLTAGKLVNTGQLTVGSAASPWSFVGSALDVAGNGSIFGGPTLSTVGLFIGSNVYWNGGYKYKVSGQVATEYVQVAGQHIWSTAPFGTANDPITFTQVMNIDASGNLLVGTTSAGGRVSVLAISGVGQFIKVAEVNATIMEFRNAQDVGGSITIAAGGGTSYNSPSDERLKHDIVDAPDAADLIDAIKVRSFKWKVDDSEQRYGMIAQELLDVAPEAVSQLGGPDPMLGVDYSKLVPMLVKELQSVRARLAQLEGK